jgi:hypothetical protein
VKEAKDLSTQGDANAKRHHRWQSITNIRMENLAGEDEEDGVFRWVPQGQDSIDLLEIAQWQALSVSTVPVVLEDSCCVP